MGRHAYIIVYAVYDSSYDNHPLSQKLDPRLDGLGLGLRVGVLGVVRVWTNPNPNHTQNTKG